MATLIAGLGLGLRPDGQAQDKSDPPSLSANRVGCVVTGKVDTGDPITGRRAFPHAGPEIELAFRGDGVVLWRKARQ